MTPRKRSSRKRLLPPNLYESRGYYSYRNPVTKEWFGIGRDRQSAVNQAIEANLHVAGEMYAPRLIDKIQGTAHQTVGKWLEKYAEILAERTLSEGTREVYRGYARRMQAMLGEHTKLASVTALQVSDGLDAIARNHPQTAKLLRGWMKDCFAAAAVKGWRGENDNPIRETRAPHVTVRRARLTFEVFEAIYTRESGWFRNALALAIVSGQRRGDIAEARFKDVREGFWWLEQEKTGTRLCIPLDLRLECMGLSLADVIRQCRSTGVLSPHLIHQDERVGGPTRPGARLNEDSLTARFRHSVQALGSSFGDKHPPTFHEIRSLSSRLYRKQGNVNPQELLGHKSEKSTLIYQEGRGEWIEVKVGTV